jgi:hypothetical protein
MGIAPAEPTTLMTHGAESLLRLKEYLPIPTRRVLDYFHVAMKVRHVDQCIGRIPPYRFFTGWFPLRAPRPIQLCADTYGVGGVPNLRSRSTDWCGCSIECEMKSRNRNVQRVWQSPICATLKHIYRRMRRGSSATESGEMLARSPPGPRSTRTNPPEVSYDNSLMEAADRKVLGSTTGLSGTLVMRSPRELGEDFTGLRA